MILSLDIATTTGWAVGSPGDKPIAGLVKTSGDIGQKMSQLRYGIQELGHEYKPDLIIFEQPLHHVPKQGSSNVLRLALALCGVAEMIAHDAGVRCVEVPISTWRKHFIGYGRAPKDAHKGWCKDQVIHRCQLLGWGDLPHDAAEACGIWDYACSLRSTAPGLFQGVR